jgi:hypothetical protein
MLQSTRHNVQIGKSACYKYVNIDEIFLPSVQTVFNINLNKVKCLANVTTG